MVRITRKVASQGSTLMIEGKLQGQAVQVLRNECRTDLENGTRVTLDLSGVTYVDENGIRLLRRLAQDRVQITHCSALVAELFGV